ncbi:hypothetical protein BA70_01075 [Bacillus zhangzhouensis]|uniref:Uncharacterized protein n=1 Tax=Bacillus zhangzhouensis TaxID=1178540 RepID=A0A081LG36_9BACI|nr:hypothetical protein BA70_01075 [Bacillus zhangzhouensis]
MFDFRNFLKISSGQEVIKALVRATPSVVLSVVEVALAVGTYEERSNPKERATPVIVFFHFITIIPFPKSVFSYNFIIGK